MAQDENKNRRTEYSDEFSRWLEERGKLPVTIMLGVLVVGGIAFAVWGK